MSARFSSGRDLNGYRTTTDGRWKAKEHPATGFITLTDTTRRAWFVDTSDSWTRLPTWDAVREVVAAHR